MFSRRTALPRVTNALTLALERTREARSALLDLTVSNPTTAGLPYDAPRVLSALADARALEYAPSPFGLLTARQAVAQLYAEGGVVIDPSHIVLTASTSEAYAFLFKLLCDDGDDVLVPQPSYPLFDLLARFEGVRLTPYSLAYDGRWHIDPSTIEAAIGPRTRAILMVSPNNPTGSYVDDEELEMLARTGLPLVSDEVFRPFALGTHKAPAKGVLSARAGLVFALNGLSKLAALPQMKLGWIAVGGQDEARVAEALERLELLGDAFLSVGTPVQLALPELLAQRHTTHDAIMRRLEDNLTRLRERVDGTAATLLDVQGGWYATLRLPDTETDEAWALLFLEEDAVYVHPGHFFDFPAEAHIVVSLLTPEAVFAEGIAKVLARLEAHITPRT
jgi:alanine-synthesizing transaminase